MAGSFRCAIGILAHNEEQVIVRTLASLLRQDLFQREDVAEAFVHCVPNGCTDRTAERVRDFFAGLTPATAPSVRGEVTVLQVGGKANAWNTLVHEIVDERFDFLVMMDADIQLGPLDTLSRLIAELQHNPIVHVACSRALKRVPDAAHPLFARMSISGSSIGDAGPHAIAGSLYAARPSLLRRYWLPPGLPVEDGFLRAMVVTEGFTKEDVVDHVQRVEGASHYYEGCVDIAGLFHHEVRMLVGSQINAIVYHVLWAAEFERPTMAAQYLRKVIEEQPDWLRHTVDSYVARSGRWALSRAHVTYRLQRMSDVRGLELLRKLPVATAALVFDAVVAVRANRLLRASQAVGFW